MTNSRFIVKASCVATVAILLAACGATDTPTTAAADDEADGVSVEAADAAGTPMTLPFKSDFGLSKALFSKPFRVRAHSTVVVTAKGKWTEPGKCHVPSFTITLYTASEKGPGRVVATRRFPTNGVAHVESWKGLEAGEYALELAAANDVSTCHLVGDVDIVDR